jgi:hypothetical protein
MAKIDWKDADGTATSVEQVDGRGGPIYTVAFNYKVDGHWCGGTFTTRDEYRVGDSVAVRYDPKNPDYNDLEQKENRQRWIVGGVVVVVVLVLIWVALRKG